MRLAVIGAGRRLCEMLIGMRDVGIQIAAIADPDPQTVKNRLDELKIDIANIRFTDDTDALLRQADQFDAFAIGTRCNLHTPMAVKVAATGKALFLEKPVAISQQQLEELQAAWRGRENQVVVSFPLRVTPAFRIARQTLQSGRLGVINQVQAFNNVPYGEVYFETWHRCFKETGGLWLQKATHDFDYLTHLVSARPMRVAAMMTQRVFGTGRTLQPDRKPSTDIVYVDKHQFQLPANEDITNPDEDLADMGSRFHAGIRNQDAGSAIIWYDNGVIVSYDQNFVTRRAAGSRGAIITGFNGTLQWDWYPEPHIRIVDHDSTRVDNIDCPAEGGHGGGDLILQQALVDLIHGKPNTAGDLNDGLLSVAICLAARKAAWQHTVEDIPDFGIYPPAEQTIDPATIEQP